MANALFDPARNSFLTAGINWTGGTAIAVSLVRGYTFNAAHQFLNQVTGAGGTLVGTKLTLANKTATAGVADADDGTFGTVAAGAAIPAMIGYVDTGNSATSNLIFFIDTGTGLPVTPNGGEIVVVWDAGVNRIFKL